jgi:hypothetical protein
VLLCRLTFHPNGNRKISDLKDPKLRDDRGRARGRSQVSAGTVETSTLPSNLR